VLASVRSLSIERAWHVRDARWHSSGGPIPRCAALWRTKLLAALPKVELVLLVGGYAQTWALKDRAKDNMTETVRAWRDYGPNILPTPHPSWRNTVWLKKNPWFDAEVTPYLRQRVHAILQT